MHAEKVTTRAFVRMRAFKSPGWLPGVLKCLLHFEHSLLSQRLPAESIDSDSLILQPLDRLLAMLMSNARPNRSSWRD